MEYDLMKEPGYIFNLDETGLQLNNKPGYVLAKKFSTDFHFLTSAEKGGTIPVMACCSAEGHFLSPVCTIKGVNKKREFEDGLPPGSDVIMSKKSAHVTSEVFMTWLKDHLVSRKPSGKVLMMETHHTSMTLTFWTSQMKTTLFFCVYPVIQLTTYSR
jgi:hypothetical protein